MAYQLTNQQACQFMLLKHGLIDDHQFEGKQGVMAFIQQVGCIQFDPVDVCGKNAEITLQSRVKNFTKSMLADLLYKDRQLFDYLDKQLAIIPVADWPYFERYREVARQSGSRFEGLDLLEKEAANFIQANGAVSSKELPLEGRIDWFSGIHWSGGGNASVARSVLEQSYSAGKLVVHHKKGTRKYYDLATNHIPADILNAPDPLPDDFEHMKWRVKRRIGAVGLLWNRPSDAWLRIENLKPNIRKTIFKDLIDTGAIIPITVENVSEPLYCLASDLPILERVLKNEQLKPRMELIAPLDCFMWDRKLIKAIFDFSYTWEIYTPEAKRQYGAYTLPLLYGEQLIGRVEAINDRKNKTLVVKNIWFEVGIKQTKKFQLELEKCLKRFAIFNECHDIQNIQELI